MLFPLVVAFVAVSLGALLALTAKEGSRAMAPIRGVAIVASGYVILTHLLPDALRELGVWAFAAFALGVAFPALAEAAARRLAASRSKPGTTSEMAHAAGVEIAFVGLVVHRFGDGLSMGGFSATSPSFLPAAFVVLAISAHIVPVTTLMILAVASVRSRRSAVVHAGILAASTMAGVVAGAVAVQNGHEHESPWISGIVAGLLLHIVVHDIRKPGRHVAHEH